MQGALSRQGTERGHEEVHADELVMDRSEGLAEGVRVAEVQGIGHRRLERLPADTTAARDEQGDGEGEQPSPHRLPPRGAGRAPDVPRCVHTVTWSPVAGTGTSAQRA